MGSGLGLVSFFFIFGISLAMIDAFIVFFVPVVEGRVWIWMFCFFPFSPFRWPL